MKTLAKQNGYTLVEIVIVIVLLGILASAGSGVIVQAFDSYFTTKNITGANWQSALAIERMTRDLKAITSSNDILYATSSRFRIKDLDGSDIDYQVTNDQLLRNNQVLADGINAINFTYYNSNAAITTTIEQIRYLVVTLNIDYKNTNFQTATTIYLWNLK